MKKINPEDIVAFAPFCGLFPIEVDLVYANPAHPENHFGQIYHPKAQIWGHRDLVKVVLLAAKRLHEAHGWTLVVKDCLRTVEAQELMIETPVVKANPHWLEEPRFLSSPGQGGHPRGMAVDVMIQDVDLGTPFDHFSSSTDKEHNLAHREYLYMTEEVRTHRKILEEAMLESADIFNLPLFPIPEEWWDFRFPASYTREFLPLRDGDLLPHQKMVEEAQRLGLKPDIKILEELKKYMSF